VKPVSAADIIAGVKISKVWEALGGAPLRSRRGAAFWRGGDGPSVSIDDAKGTWFDHAANEGGGVLDLVGRVRGGDRQESLRWLAAFAGVALDDRVVSIDDRKAWGAERRAVDRELPAARLFRRAAMLQAEELLGILKAAIFDPTVRLIPQIGEIAYWERRLDRWRRLDGAELVAEYQTWRTRDPKLTAALVAYMRDIEAAEVRAAVNFISELERAA